MAIIKVQSEGVNLSDTFAFTGTVTGAGEASPFGNTVTVTSEGGAATTNLVQGLLKSWVNIDTDSTVGILDSVGITSISDNGSGNFYINLSNNMNNSSYSPVGTVDGSGFTINVHTCQTDGRNTAQYRVYSFSGSGSAADYDSLMYHTAGDLA